MRSVQEEEEDEDAEAGSVASDGSEPPFSCCERAREGLKCVVREGPVWLACMIIVLWVLDAAANRYGWYDWAQTLKYGNLEDPRR